MRALAFSSPVVRSCNALLLAAGLAWALAGAAPALAQDDLPGRVGRLAVSEGPVFVSNEEDPDEWKEALQNYTLTSGDNLWAGGGARAEVDYGGGQFRLGSDSNVHIARIDDALLALFVAQGSVVLRVRALDAGETVRIDASNAQFALTRTGLYRVEVDADRTRTRLVVREGEAIVITAGREQQVLPGQTALVAGESGGAVEVRNGFSADDLDAWSAQRDRRYDRARNSGYVSPQMIGQADLEQYGAWSSYPEYGSVWFPKSVPSEWAPYRYGRWTWVSGWGWTWVDDAPWGYAPFHYGRWVFVGSRWGWAPGGFVARPLWAPAMVGWVGGPGLSVSVSIGGPVVGWVPLGWGEPFMPWWNNCSHRCWTRFNRPFAVNYAERPSAPPTRFVNWSAPGGATAVGSATLSRRAPVQTNMVALRPGSFSSAAVLPQAPQVARPRPGTISGARPVQAPPQAPSRVYRERPIEASLPGVPSVRPTPGGERPINRGGSTSAPAAQYAPQPAPPQSRVQAQPPQQFQGQNLPPQPSTAAPPASRVQPQPAPPSRVQPQPVPQPVQPSPRVQPQPVPQPGQPPSRVQPQPVQPAMPSGQAPSRVAPQAPYGGQQQGFTRSTPSAPSVQPLPQPTRPAPQPVPSAPSTRMAPPQAAVPQVQPMPRPAQSAVPQVQPMTRPTQPAPPVNVQAPPPAQNPTPRANAPAPRPQPREGSTPDNPRAVPR